MSTETVHLIISTGEGRVDTILQAVVGRFERAFPDRVAGYYVTGSWCSDAALFDPADPANSSDVDLHVIFRDRLHAEEQGTLGQVLRACQRISPVPLEVHATGEDGLSGYWDVALKQRSLLIYGVDSRDQVVLPSPEEHLQRAMTYPPYAMAQVRGQEVFAREPRIEYPLGYPDPEDRFYGYALASTGPMVSIATWAATIMLAAQTQCITGTKRDAVERYQQLIGDGWSPLISEVFTKCKLSWRHRIPASPAEQEHLRGLCERMLSLENHLLEIYRPYLTKWLGQEENKQFAVRMLRMIGYADLPLQDKPNPMLGV